MRHLRKYNESTYNYTPMMDGFVEKILEYKSDFIENIKLKDQNWEIREGYAPRKTITFDNKILNKRETLAIEDHRDRMCIRTFYNDRYQNDISIVNNNIGEYASKTIDHIFGAIINTSNRAKDYLRQMEIVRNVIPKISKEEIIENFADIIDLSDSHLIEDRQRGGYQTSWRIIIEFSKKICNLKSPGLEIIMDDDNQIIVNNIMSATNRIKESYGVMTGVTFGEKKVVIDLNAIDPTTGERIG